MTIATQTRGYDYLALNILAEAVGTNAGAIGANAPPTATLRAAKHEAGRAFRRETNEINSFNETARYFLLEAGDGASLERCLSFPIGATGRLTNRASARAGCAFQVPILRAPMAHDARTFGFPRCSKIVVDTRVLA